MSVRTTIVQLSEYEKEGIDAKAIEFTSNEALLSMILTKPIGLLALADEEARVPRGTDTTLV